MHSSYQPATAYQDPRLRVAAKRLLHVLIRLGIVSDVAELLGVDRLLGAVVVATPATETRSHVEDQLGVELDRMVRATLLAGAALGTELLVHELVTHVAASPGPGKREERPEGSDLDPGALGISCPFCCRSSRFAASSLYPMHFKDTGIRGGVIAVEA